MEAAFVNDFTDLNRQINGKTFFNENCLRSAVEYAAMQGIAGEQYLVGPLLRKAHHLIAIYLGNQRTGIPNNNAQSLFEDILRTIHPPMAFLAQSEMSDVSRYFGALMGLCLAGVFRYAENREADTKKHQQNVALAISVVGIAVGTAAFPGVGVLASFIGLGAEPLAQRLVKGKSITQEIISIGGDLKASLRAINQEGYFDAEACITKLKETITRCGYVF
jgi:hypothetical protein